MEDNIAVAKLDGRSVWMRGLFMLVLLFGFWVGQFLLHVIAVVQFLWLLTAREPNTFLVAFGAALSTWLSEVGRFVCCATDEKPFPWRPWPAVNS
jgi:Domain of unknown function (DUF4389)